MHPTHHVPELLGRHLSLCPTGVCAHTHLYTYEKQFSTRVDVLSKEFITELEKLQDNVPAFGIKEAKEIVSEQLGAPIEQKFSYFEDQPIAAASLGQVREGERPGGRKNERDDDLGIRFMTLLLQLPGSLHRSISLAEPADSHGSRLPKTAVTILLSNLAYPMTLLQLPGSLPSCASTLYQLVEEARAGESFLWIS